MRLLYPLAKGIAMGGPVVAIVQSGLSDFAKAVIIALISALIGYFGMVTAAWINARSNEKILIAQERTERHVEDIKGAIGATRRITDPHDNPPEN